MEERRRQERRRWRARRRREQRGPGVPPPPSAPLVPELRGDHGHRRGPSRRRRWRRFLPRRRGEGAREAAPRRRHLARRRLARRPRGFLLLVFSLFDEHWLFFLPSSGCRLRPLCRVGRASGCDYGGLGWQRRPRARQRAPLLSLDAAAALVFGGGSGRRRWRRSFFSLFRRRPAARAVRGRPRGDAGGALPPRPLLRSAVAEEGEARPPLLERRRRGGAGRTGGGGGNGGGNGSDRGLAPRREGRGRRRGRWDAGARAARGCDLCGGPDGAGDGETLFFFPFVFQREPRCDIFFKEKNLIFFQPACLFSTFPQNRSQAASPSPRRAPRASWSTTL